MSLHITMSLQSQYVIAIYRDVNPTENRCRHDIACPLDLRAEVQLWWPIKNSKVFFVGKLDSH